MACLIFLWVFSLVPIAHAEDQSVFRRHLSDISRRVQWLPAHAAEATRVDSSTIEYQSLSYLQGYSPAPAIKNVLLYNKSLAGGGYNLFLSSDSPRAELLDMNGRIVHEWHFPCTAIPNIDHQFCPPYWIKAHMLNDGSLLALVPYVGLIKLNRDSHLMWFSTGILHHDFDVASNGHIYALSMEKTAIHGLPVILNRLSLYSPSGRLIKELSLYDLFKKYPDQSFLERIDHALQSKTVLNAVYGQGDVFHANSLQIITNSLARHSNVFKEGQVLLSVREMGLIMAIDPVSEKIAWVMDAGPWHKGQHCARLLENGDILIFDNFDTPALSRVIEFNPVSKKIVWDYQSPERKFFSPLLGACDRLPNGNTLVTESTNGHSFEVTPDKIIVWEFYNPHRTGNNDALIAVIYQMERIDPASVQWIRSPIDHR